MKHGALRSGDVDVIDAYTTDGLLADPGLVVLEDDLASFPPYEAAPLVSPRLRREAPAALAALAELAGQLDEGTMRELNRRLEVAGEPVHLVARDGLLGTGLLGVAASGDAGGGTSGGAGRGAHGDLRVLAGEGWLAYAAQGNGVSQ